MRGAIVPGHDYSKSILRRLASSAHRSRLASLVVLALACSSEDSGGGGSNLGNGSGGHDGAVGQSGAAGHGGGSGGDAGAVGRGGSTGYGGSTQQGGLGGQGGFGSTADPSCADAGGPFANGGCQGQFLVGSAVNSRGFEAQEGREVKLVSILGESTQTLSTVVSQGLFHLEYLFASSACTGDGAYVAIAATALYVDVDGNGICDPTMDKLFVWTVRQNNEYTCEHRSITPSSPKCDVSNSYPYNAAAVLAVTQEICPAVGSCLDFCPTLPPFAGLDTSAFYCPVDAGVPGDSGVSDASTDGSASPP